ncbi:SNF2 family DNA or RNA helicase [Paenibacillus cellulosilyticus]|uniref:SNF2 family DNA or RNA helicase n=1 Tax=Paenibacillus cellulosilyticus TaxID=375489 RepID=A0A2V2YSK7_9BACL|nr:DEAD/DEAH box helicase [Paenibacillus cellulosilyticus]PWV98567.1 SNF2 family DNA or RNA helicase [Paenibacillus cellulosilyticus]QKS44171.1 DEAD/DEAH box helicase [Paenibacillus cellulosilyticus]
MSMRLTQRSIQQLCGTLAYKKGEAFRKAGKVTFTKADPLQSYYEAVVQGTEPFTVTAALDTGGELKTTCTCPSLSSYRGGCSHVAAVLLDIQLHEAAEGKRPQEYAAAAVGKQKAAGMAESDMNGNVAAGEQQASSSAFEESRGMLRTAASQTSSGERGAQHASDDVHVMSELLELFGGRPQRPSGTRSQFDTREPLSAEITVSPFQDRMGRQLLGIELRLGPEPKRLYVVQKVHAFLEAVERRESYAFGKYWTYDPELYRFPQQEDAVLQALIRIVRDERLYRTSVDGFAHAAQAAGDRMLFIPPAAWGELPSLLAEVPNALLSNRGQIYEGIALLDEPLPLRFEFKMEESEGSSQQEAAAYQLQVEGLDSLVILPAYGLAIADGKLLGLTEAQSMRLTEVQRLLDQTSEQRFRITQEQIEPFMERVVPGLMKLGSVHMAKNVSERVVHTPLKAKLYLDRVRERLLAALEFHYGDLVVNPLESASQRKADDRILMRDGEREQRILALMAKADFVETEGGYLMSGDDAEYEFLYHIVPELEKLLDVYATSAVKLRIHVGTETPTVRAEIDERTDWLEFKFDLGGIPERDIRKVLKAVEEKRRFYRLPSGALLPLESEEMEEIARLMNLLGVRHADLIGSGFKLPAVRGLRLIDADQESRTVKLGRSLRQLLHNLRQPDSLNFPIPEALDAVLRDYQQVGYQWLKTLAHYRFGGILADDMGLGKTVQSIAFLLSVLPEIREQGLPAFIVCPASLLYNWQQELERFAPSIRSVIISGGPTERDRLLQGDADVIITSYPLLRRDIKTYAKRSFHTLILDEAQYFKNYATQTAQSVKTLQAKHRFALTGTPVENRLEELWSIFDAVFPDLFPSRQRFHELTRETVAKRARPFLLRRLKRDVLKELPDAIETLQSSDLLPEQKKLYAAYLAKLQAETLKHLDDPDDWEQNRIRILAGLTRLRQLCCHPALFVEDYRGGSSKLEQLLDIIEDCRSAGKRMLVFSQFTSMLEIIRRELGVRGVPMFSLDGSTPPKERAELCSRFNSGERDVFLISLKAGGTGLNLTGADTVILYDLWWNPAVEQQAADRAHRIGQRNVVQVIRLVAKGTVEDKMFELQQRKKRLIDEVIQAGEQPLEALSEADIREILQI